MKYIKINLFGEPYLVRQDVIETMIEEHLMNSYDDEEDEEEYDLDDEEIYAIDLKWKKYGE